MLLRLFYLLGRQKGNSWKNSQNANRDKMKSTNQWKYMQANKIMLSTILSKFWVFFFFCPHKSYLSGFKVWFPKPVAPDLKIW